MIKYFLDIIYIIWIFTPIIQCTLLKSSTVRISKNEISVKDEFIMDVNNEQVINMFNNHNIDEIIHGHTHRANIHTIKIENNIFRRIVLGDWYNRSFILYYDKDGIKIERNNLN